MRRRTQRAKRAQKEWGGGLLNERENYIYRSVHFDGLAIQKRGLVFPLTNSFKGGLRKDRVARN